MKFTYSISCVNADGDLINEMIDNAEEITYEAFIGHINPEELDTLFPIYKKTGMHIKDDWHISYHHGSYDEQECYFLTHSCIEYIFTQGKSNVSGCL